MIYVLFYVNGDLFDLAMNNWLMDEGIPPLINPTCGPCKVYFWGIQQ